MKKILLLCLFGSLWITTIHAQVNRNLQPKPGPDPKINIKKAQTFKLDNGMEVLVVENHKLPSASIFLTLDNPPFLEGELSGTGDLTGEILGNGTMLTSKDEYNDQIDQLGSSINFSGNGASASTLSRYFPKTLKLFAEGAIKPLFSNDELESKKAQMIESLNADEKSASSISIRAYKSLLYGKNNPFGEITLPENVKKITLDDVKKYYNTYYVPNNAYLVIVGDVKFSEVKKLVTENFSSWMANPNFPIPSYSKAENISSPEINLIDVPTAVQTEIKIGNIVHLNYNDPDYFATKLAAQILGGGGESRLFTNLREKHSWTYGAYAKVGASKYVSDFVSFAAVRSNAVDSSIVQILKEIENIKTSPVTQDELDLAKAKYIGNFVMTVEKPRTVANFTLSEKTENLPSDYYENYIKNLNSVTLDQVQKAAEKYFSASRMIVVGNATNCLDGLKKLNIPINYYDGYANPTKEPKLNAPNAAE